MTKTINLPEWASLKLDEDGEPKLRGTSIEIDVDAAAMYEEFFERYRALYADGRKPNGFRGTDEEWDAVLEDLRSGTPSAYWCEVAYQGMKMELQVSTRTFNMNLLVHDPSKTYAQKDRPGPRKASEAAGGSKGGREAREHFKNLNGFLPG